MVPAIITLIVVLIIVAVLYWALTQLWPLTGGFATSAIGRIVYVLLIVLGVFAIVFYGVLPVIEAIPGALSQHPFRSQ